MFEAVVNLAGPVCMVLVVILMVATIVAKMTKTDKDDIAIDAAADKFFKFTDKLPTWGVNPKTKKLWEAYKELKAEADRLKDKNAG